MDKNETVPMGIGPIGREQVFPRTFRFLLTPKKNPEIQYFTSKAAVSYSSKTLDTSVYERQHLQAHDWIMEMLTDGYEDDYVLTAVDGCGHKLYVLEFRGVKLTGHKVGYDYASSDVVTHQLSLTYREMVKLYQLPEKTENSENPAA